jgi:hypothetical protein
MAALLTVDPSRCPLCGGDNRCAIELERATGRKQPPCWCMDEGVTFPPSLHASLPSEARGLACICANCMASALAKEPNP